MDTVGQRLRRAIGRRGSIRSFQVALKEHLEDRGVDGWSYPSINEYLKDEVSPRVELLAHAAEVLDVRFPWLATGEGKMTEGEAEVASIESGAIEEAEGSFRWKRAVRMKFDVLAGLGFPPPDLSPTALRLDDEGYVRKEDTAKGLKAFFRSIGAGHIPHWVPPMAEARRRLDVDAKTLGAALRGPLDALKIEAARMHKDDFNDYLTAMTPVLLALAGSIPTTEDNDDAS